MNEIKEMNEVIDYFQFNEVICVCVDDFHRIKSEKRFFDEIRDGVKPFEYRKNDRDYKLDDIVEIRLWDKIKKQYLGESIFLRINYIIFKTDFMNLNEYCIFAFDIIHSFVYIVED